MKKILFTVLMFMPLAISAQSTLTPQQQLEIAQKQLEEAQKALNAAKEAQKKLEEANKQLEAQQKEAQQAQPKETQKQDTNQPEVKQTETPKSEETKKGSWYIPTAEVKENKAEKPKMANGTVLKADPKYLAGAVPTDSNGKVVFTMTTNANGKSAKQIYDLVFGYMQSLTEGEQNIRSRVALVNPDEHVIANTMDEWLVFNNSFISLDRTEFKYQLVANISDNSLTLTMKRLAYNYEETRSTGFKENAEEVITDDIALNKKKNGLAKIYGKFRKFTIDRKDTIFKDITELVRQ